jgi:hypothetical protein
VRVLQELEAKRSAEGAPPAKKKKKKNAAKSTGREGMESDAAEQRRKAAEDAEAAKAAEEEKRRLARQRDLEAKRREADEALECRRQVCCLMAPCLDRTTTIEVSNKKYSQRDSLAITYAVRCKR